MIKLTNIILMTGIILCFISGLHATWIGNELSGNLFATSILIIGLSVVLYLVFGLYKDKKSKSD